jgi:hypothetical protein
LPIEGKPQEAAVLLKQILLVLEFADPSEQKQKMQVLSTEEEGHLLSQRGEQLGCVVLTVLQVRHLPGRSDFNPGNNKRFSFLSYQKLKKLNSPVQN